MFWASSTYLHDIPVLELRGSLDTSSGAEASHVLAQMIAMSSRLIVDLGKLESMDISGLRILIQARKRCDAALGYLILSNPAGKVLALLSLMNMDAQFLIWGDDLEHDPA